MIIDAFFAGSFEEVVNQNMLQYDFLFPEADVKKYIGEIISQPLADFVERVCKSPNTPIDAKDVFQFSSFEDATTNICAALNLIEDPGVSWEEAGKLLLNDGADRKKGALVKYGENHLKTAEALGLLYSITNVYFLTCIGRVFIELNEHDRQKLMVRLVLRNRLVGQLIRDALGEQVDLKAKLSMLSLSTYTRRRSNVKYIINLLLDSNEYDFDFLKENLIF